MRIFTTVILFLFANIGACLYGKPSGDKMEDYSVKTWICEACDREFKSLEAIGAHFDTNEHWLAVNDPDNPNIWE